MREESLGRGRGVEDDEEEEENEEEDIHNPLLDHNPNPYRFIILTLTLPNPSSTFFLTQCLSTPNDILSQYDWETRVRVRIYIKN